jgi:hypothetical protein
MPVVGERDGEAAGSVAVEVGEAADDPVRLVGAAGAGVRVRDRASGEAAGERPARLSRSTRSVSVPPVMVAPGDSGVCLTTATQSPGSEPVL